QKLLSYVLIIDIMATTLPPNNRRQDPLVEKVTPNKEDIQLIWFDENMSNSDDFLLTQSMLIKLNTAA
ncbi:unnamed protein product, partial [Rotaria sp. Silwood1]